MAQNHRNQFGAARVVLLIEIERYCSQPNCSNLNRIGLTKNEARVYNGFNCQRCEGWNDDCLSERDVPEWWKEIAFESERN